MKKNKLIVLYLFLCSLIVLFIIFELQILENSSFFPISFQNPFPLDKYFHLALSSPSWSSSCTATIPINIFISTSGAGLPGCVALIYSIYTNTPCEIHIFVSVDAENRSMLTNWLDAYFPAQEMQEEGRMQLTIVDFIPEHFWGVNYTQILVRGRRKELGHPLNFARYFFPSLFPELRKEARLIYLDDDTLVLDDISKLNEFPLKSHEIGAFSCDRSHLSRFFNTHNPRVKSYQMPRYFCCLNAGVFVVDIQKWLHNNMTHNLWRWVQLNQQENIYGGGSGGGASQPPMILEFHQRHATLPDRWHTRRLGGFLKVECFNDSQLLHWNGPRKPWLFEGVPCFDVWEKYFLPNPFTNTSVEGSERGAMQQ